MTDGCPYKHSAYTRFISPAPPFPLPPYLRSRLWDYLLCGWHSWPEVSVNIQPVITSSDSSYYGNSNGLSSKTITTTYLQIFAILEFRKTRYGSKRDRYIWDVAMVSHLGTMTCILTMKRCVCDCLSGSLVNVDLVAAIAFRLGLCCNDKLIPNVVLRGTDLFIQCYWFNTILSVRVSDYLHSALGQWGCGSSLRMRQRW